MGVAGLWRQVYLHAPGGCSWTVLAWNRENCSCGMGVSGGPGACVADGWGSAGGSGGGFVRRAVRGLAVVGVLGLAIGVLGLSRVVQQVQLLPLSRDGELAGDFLDRAVLEPRAEVDVPDHVIEVLNVFGWRLCDQPCAKLHAAGCGYCFPALDPLWFVPVIWFTERHIRLVVRRRPSPTHRA